MEETMESEEGFTTDVLVEIMRRVQPPISQRRLRLVCRRWKDAIDEHMPETRKKICVKTLAFVTDMHLTCNASVYIVDDEVPGEDGRRSSRQVWTTGPSVYSFHGRGMVGTCNGLLCLCDDEKPGGAITLFNPVTGETLAVPPSPCADAMRFLSKHMISFWHKAYSFGYNPETGQYKIVHVPWNLHRIMENDAVHVLTLGEASWRSLPSPNASCTLDAGVISIDGVTYWIAQGTEKVMSFDLRDERVTPATTSPLPVPAGPGCYLTDVHGRLGIAASDSASMLKKTEVWVLEGERKEQPRKWNLRYRVMLHRHRGQRRRLTLTWPHFAHGEYILTQACWGRNFIMYRSRSSECGVVQISEKKPGMAVASAVDGCIRQTFAYVETTEPLNLYMLCSK